MTNSSSTTYIWPLPDAVNKITKILRDMIKLSGSNKKVDELYDIVEEIDPKWIDSVNRNAQYMGLNSEDEKETSKLNGYSGNVSGDHICHKILKVFVKGTDRNILKEIMDLFEMDEVSYYTYLPE